MLRWDKLLCSSGTGFIMVKDDGSESETCSEVIVQKEFNVENTAVDILDGEYGCFFFSNFISACLFIQVLCACVCICEIRNI